MPIWPAWLLEELEDDEDSTSVESSSSEDETCSGSKIGRAPNKNRNRIDGAARLYADYFSSNPVYSDSDFRRRFRMQKSLFMRIHNAVIGFEKVYYEQRSDACGVLGLSSLQKTTAALRMLAYGTPA